ncbi:MAG: lytic transglycosylase domain-containing protein [Pseudomonadota bacterium]
MKPSTGRTGTPGDTNPGAKKTMDQKKAALICRAAGIIPLLLAAVILFSPCPVRAASCSLPMTLDYALLNSLVQVSHFHDYPGVAKVLDEQGSCRRILLSEPRFSHENGRLAFETRVDVKYGKRIFKSCLSPVTWSGYLVVYQTPHIRAQDWTLSFSINDSRLLALDRKPAKIAGVVWDFIKDNVYAYLEAIHVDLGPPVKDMKDFLVPVFSRYQESDALDVIRSIHPGEVAITEKALTITSQVTIPDGMLVEPAVREQPLTEEEVDAFIDVWETWDTFLVNCLMALAGQPLSQEERQTLLDVILDTRYTFIQELTNPSGRQVDFVREQFVQSWSRLHPVFRHYLKEGSGQSLLGYLAFFTAADALVSLDAIGPSLGIDISREGFTRLIRMLIADGRSPRSSPEEENPQLRELLGLAPQAVQDSDDTSSPGMPGMKSGLSSLWKILLQPGTAWAGTGTSLTTQPSLADIKQWIVDRTDYRDYLTRIKELLAATTSTVLKTSALPGEHTDLFRLIVLATAWQESCLKHYLKSRNNSVGYVRSYNNSSVGLMQINERVWKGIYSIKRLRWDIQYNILAGCEILDIYFNRYALRYMKEIGDADTWTDLQLAGSVYAMYNGGPGEFKKFLDRHVTDELYKSDRLFRQKFEWVKAGDWDKLSECL